MSKCVPVSVHWAVVLVLPLGDFGTNLGGVCGGLVPLYRKVIEQSLVSSHGGGKYGVSVLSFVTAVCRDAGPGLLWMSPQEGIEPLSGEVKECE